MTKLSFEQAWGAVPLPPGFKKVGSAPRVSFEEASADWIDVPLAGWQDVSPQAMPQLDIVTEQPRDLLSAPASASMLPGEGVAKSFGSGVQRGVAGLAGFPGDVRSMAAKGIEAATGYDLPEMPSWLPDFIGGIPTGKMTTQDLQGGLERAGMPTYRPQNTAEEYARTVGEFVPAAIGGPAGLARRSAQVMVPALASETAGQLTEGTEAEPYARAGAAVAGGLAGARAMAPRKPAMPTTEDLKASASSLYKQADNAGLVITPQSFGNVVQKMTATAKQEGLNRKLHPDAHAALEHIADTGTSGRPLTLKEIDTLRQVAKDAAASTKPGERRIARVLINQLDDYMDGLKMADVQAGDRKAAVQAIKEARSLWGRYRKSEIIDTALTKAKDVVGANYTNAGLETAIRQRFRALLHNDRQMRHFTKTEQAAIRRVVRGGAVDNTLRLLGKAAIRGPVSAMPSGLALMAIDPVTAGIVAGVGEGARRGATAMGLRNANRVSEMVRAGPQPARQPWMRPEDTLVQAILGMQGARQ